MQSLTDWDFRSRGRKDLPEKVVGEITLMVLNVDAEQLQINC